MAVNAQLLAVLSKIESDVLADLSQLLIPGLEAEVNSLLPASVVAIVNPIEAASLAYLQAGLASLIAKVPGLSAPVAPV